MLSRDIRHIAEAQKRAREIVLEVFHSVRAGDTEREVVERMERLFAKVGVHRWLHTPYAWWGERSRFGGFATWEADALPTRRRLTEGECFILDAAPLVGGYPADFACSGMAGGDSEGLEAHGRMVAALSEIKTALLDWAKIAADGTALFERVGAFARERGFSEVHPGYPAGVLGHTLEPFPNFFGWLPRMGRGFQWPLLGTYGLALFGHQLLGRPYPFIRDGARGPMRGLFAVEPHLGLGEMGAKFESVLLIDGDETRWLDPELPDSAARARSSGRAVAG